MAMKVDELSRSGAGGAGRGQDGQHSLAASATAASCGDCVRVPQVRNGLWGVGGVQVSQDPKLLRFYGFMRICGHGRLLRFYGQMAKLLRNPHPMDNVRVA